MDDVKGYVTKLGKAQRYWTTNPKNKPSFCHVTWTVVENRLKFSSKLCTIPAHTHHRLAELRCHIPLDTK